MNDENTQEILQSLEDLRQEFSTAYEHLAKILMAILAEQEKGRVPQKR